MKYNWQETEREWLEWILTETRHNILKTAKLAGLSTGGVKAKIKRHQLLDWHEQYLLDEKKKRRAKLYGDV